MKCFNEVIHLHRLQSFAKNGNFRELEKEIRKGQNNLSTLMKELTSTDSEHNYSPLVWAAKEGHVEVVQFLSDLDIVNLNFRGGWNHSTAAIIATECAHTQCVEILLKKGVDCNLQNDFLSTPLMIAAERGYEDITALLLRYGADVNLRNELQYTALILATESNHLNIIQLLCDSKANIEESNKFGKTALILASEFNRYEATSILISYGADVNRVSNRGKTALMLAALKGNTRIVELLLSHGADANFTDPDGESALLYATMSGDLQIIRMLLDDGASLFHPNKAGVTPLMRAAEYGHSNLVEMILSQQHRSLHRDRVQPKAMVLGTGKADEKHCRRCRAKFLFSKSFKHRCQRCKAIYCSRCSSYRLKPSDVSTNHHTLARTELDSFVSMAGRRLCFSCYSVLTRNGFAVDHTDVNVGWKADEINTKSKDGSTAMHYAACKGQLKIFIYFFDRLGDLGIRNNVDETALDTLRTFYIQNEKKFIEDFIPIATSKPELLELVADCLCEFPSPNAVLNASLPNLLRGLKCTKDEDIILGLIQIAVGIKKAIKRHKLEGPDLEEQLQIVNRMLLEALGSACLEDEENIIRVLLHPEMRSRPDLPKEVKRAMCVVDGPLHQCIEHNILPIMSNHQISLFIDNIFTGCLRKSKPRPLYYWQDLFQMRSNYVNWRTSPAVNFYLEGLGKLLFLIVVALLAMDFHRSEAYAKSLLVLFVGTVIHEIGELHESNWNLRLYLSGVWDYLDLITLGLLSGWVGLTWINGLDVDYYNYYLNNKYLIPFGDWKDSMIPHPDAKALLAVSAIPLSITLLRFLSPIRILGQYILTVFAMAAELLKFILVILFCSLGFGIMFHALFPYVWAPFVWLNSSTSGRLTDFESVFVTLFSAALGQTDYNNFMNEPYQHIGVAFLTLYKLMTQVVLVNLIIARFAAKHNEIHTQSSEIWSLLKVYWLFHFPILLWFMSIATQARNVKQYLLIREIHPFKMLPSPLSLITAAFAPLHYLVIAVTRQRAKTLQDCHITNEQQDDSLNDVKSPVHIDLFQMKTRTVSLCGVISDVVIGFVCLIPAAVYEVYLCLQELKRITTKRTYRWFLLSFVVIFPVIILAFCGVLLYELFEMRSILVFNSDGETELEYERVEHTKPFTTNVISLDPSKKYTKLLVKLVRVTFDTKPIFSSPDIYVVVEVSKQVLVTQSVKDDFQIHHFPRDNQKEFYIWFSSDSNMKSDDKTLKISVYDSMDHFLCSSQSNIEEWIANGRFEGDLMLNYKMKNIGKISIATKIESYHPDSHPILLEGKPASERCLTDFFGDHRCFNDPDSIHILVLAAEFKDTEDVKVTKEYFVSIKLLGRENNTDRVRASDGRPCWNEEFELEMIGEEAIKDKNTKMIIEVFNDAQGESVFIGGCTHYISKWLFNMTSDSDDKGLPQLKFCGSLDLFFNDEVIGSIYLALKYSEEKSKNLDDDKARGNRRDHFVKKTGRRESTVVFRNGAIVASDAKEIKINQTTNASVDKIPVLTQDSLQFSKEDRERIFYGIQEDYSYFTKNPYAHEIHEQLVHQLQDFGKLKVEKPLDGVRHLLEDLQDHHTSLSERLGHLHSKIKGSTERKKVESVESDT